MSGLSFTQAYARHMRELDELAEINAKLTVSDIQEGKTLQPIIECYQLQFHDELARIMRNLGKACKGDEISKDAVLGSCHLIEKKLLDASRKYRDE